MNNKYWFLSAKNKKLGFGDNREIELGIKHTVKGEPVLSQNGLHASKDILDTIRYGLGPVMWIVELSGKIVHSDKKPVPLVRVYSVASTRLYIEGGIDITKILRKFACMCALDVIYLWDAPDFVIEYLKTREESSRIAVRDIVEGAVKDAGLGARDNARESAWSAALPNARNAAWMACDAAFYAVGDVVRAKQRKRLEGMVQRAIKNSRSYYEL